MSARFRQRFAETLDFEDEYGDGLTNHEPMALTALHRLCEQHGLGQDALDRFCAAYRARLRPRSTAGPSPLAARYAEQIARRGWEPVTRAALSALGDALPAAAGHGLLRVYYAVEARHDLPPALFAEELARGLAYFESKRLQLYAGPRGARSLLDVLRALPGLPAHERGHYGRALQITERQAKVARHPLFVAAMRAIAPPDELLPSLTALAAVATATPDFTLLHALTTGHALVELDDLLPDYDRAPLRRGWVDFVVAAALTQGLRVEPPSSDGAAPALPIDGERIARFAADGEDHKIKATFALDRLARRTGDALFQAAARAFTAD